MLPRILSFRDGVKPLRNLLSPAADMLQANSRFLAVLGMTNSRELGISDETKKRKSRVPGRTRLNLFAGGARGQANA
jgi:hypothetical protein